MRYLLLCLLLVSCATKVPKATIEINERTKSLYEFNLDIINVLNEGYFKIPRTNLTAYQVPGYHIEQIHKLESLGNRIDTMPSGLSCFVYVTPTNIPHPYIRYMSNELTIDEVYDLAIGCFCVITNY